MEMSPEEAKTNEKAIWAHVLPFLVWIVFIPLFDPSGWEYAARTVLVSVLLLILRPWRWYPGPKLKNLPAALGVGVLVFILWVGMEHKAVQSAFPGLTGFYERFLIDLLHPGKLRDLTAGWPEMNGEPIHPYDPRLTGWPLFWVHMFGTSVVVGLFEEFFWRGFLYRWMQGTPFLKIDLGRFDWKMWLIIAVLFGIEHNEWMAGILCGLIFGWLIIRTRDIWAGIIAHALTNFLLGLYAVHCGYWQFW
jgi:membrane protease YdiL (CAAX protease family)